MTDLAGLVNQLKPNTIAYCTRLGGFLGYKYEKNQPGIYRVEKASGEQAAPSAAQTTLDRLHQAMLLFATGCDEALKRFLIEEGVGKGRRLAQALSALYPGGSDEKRWVDGALAWKKGLGF